MEKLTDNVILYHRKMDYPLWDNEIWTPLEVGAALREPVYDFGLRDNEGDNISDWNNFFAETTGIYWNWKHLTGKKYAGNIQFRRRFDINTYEELEDIFKEHRVIATRPLRFASTVEQQYACCHNATDLEAIKIITLTLYPEYEASWNKYIEEGHQLWYSNGFIMREEDYDQYCEWLFSILFSFIASMKWETPEDIRKWVEGQIKNHQRPNIDNKRSPDNAVAYQSQLGGFLSERLWTLYLQHNFKTEEIEYLPYLKMEEGI